MSFLSPLAALVAVAVVAPLAAHGLLELRARRVSRRLGLRPPPFRSRLGVPGAIAVVAGLLGVAAAQPVISGTRVRVGRSDAQVYILFDVSRSMLARTSANAPTRLARAKRLARRLRHEIPDVAVGIASLTDRVLPHLFPTLDSELFASTLADAVAIERPPPAGSSDLATDYNTLGDIATNNYYAPRARKRLLIVFSDGESRFFDEIVLGRKFEKTHVRVLFVHMWSSDEKIYLQRNEVDPGYRPDPEAAGAAERVADAGGGEVLGEDPAALVHAAKAFLASGPHTKVREQRTRLSLGPYVALAALLPLGLVLLRRNL
jgi:von Willebrand factor type A domain